MLNKTKLSGEPWGNPELTLKRSDCYVPNLILHLLVSCIDRIHPNMTSVFPYLVILLAWVGSCTRLYASSRSYRPNAKCRLTWRPFCIVLKSASMLDVVKRLGLASPTSFGRFPFFLRYSVICLSAIFSQSVLDMVVIRKHLRIR